MIKNDSNKYPQDIFQDNKNHFDLKSCWTQTCPDFANSVDPDQLASEANWSGSALFVIKYVNCISNLDQVIWLAET